MASDGIACRILIQNELLEQVDTFPYLGSQITDDGECTTEFRTRLNRGQAIEASLQKIWKSHNIPISTKIRLIKALVWPVATYGCKSWTLRKNEETRLGAFEMKGLRRMLRFSVCSYSSNSFIFWACLAHIWHNSVGYIFCWCYFSDWGRLRNRTDGCEGHSYPILRTWIVREFWCGLYGWALWPPEGVHFIVNTTPCSFIYVSRKNTV